MSAKNIIFLIAIISLVPIIAILIDYVGSNSQSRAVTTELSKESSYVFVSPAQIPFGVNNKARITVFCMDVKGFGKPNMRVALSSNADVVLSVIQGLSDEKGKALFDAFATKPVVASLDVYCGTTKIESRAQLRFQ